WPLRRQLNRFKGPINVGKTKDIETLTVEINVGQVKITGRAVVFHPGQFHFAMFVDQEGVAYDFSRFVVNPALADSRRTFKAFPGKTVEELARQAGAVFAINGHQGNFYIPNSLV